MPVSLVLANCFKTKFWENVYPLIEMEIEMCDRAKDIKTIYEKLREARLKLGLSQDYVANCLGINRSAVTQIELGNRKVNSNEITRFCKLYHLSTDYLLDTENIDMNQAVSARNFNELKDDDQEEILNLIAFKRSIARQQQEG